VHSLRLSAQAQSPGTQMYNKAFNSVASKFGPRATKAAPGIGVGNKENSFDAPSVPTHRINATAGAPPAARYDRYSEAGPNQPMAAW